MKHLRIFHSAIILSLVATLVLVSVAYAITITVDGIKEAAWDGSGGQTPGIQSDGNESNIDNRYDIKEIRWTNDSLGGAAPYGHWYLLLETYSNLDINYPALAPQIIICMDVDNNTATGTTVSGYCNDMSGVDRKITANTKFFTVAIERWTGSAWAFVSQPGGGMRVIAWQDSDVNGVADLPYIEIGVDLQSLGITNSSTCLGTIPTAIYYDNGMADLEDSVLDSGTFSMSCGTPTAITLVSAVARPWRSYTLPLLGAAALLLIAGAGLWLITGNKLSLKG